ncbi:hypothetical protein I6G66_01050 [Delftia acidovorans]|uniref:Uncharacterized protein n=1 Tax=Delftia acidovorans TaxID=80866 RepID=A0A7T2S4B5_DELAC|nr:hypothetical protein [Delftia acidovorans]QPS08685.1 hypothetical protein I6G66_01050 [Delftia acidovorans]
MKKLALTISLYILTFAQNSMAEGEKEWMLLSRSDGCISLGELYFEYQYLNQRKTPGEIFNEIKKKYKTTTIKPFVDYIKEEEKDGEKIGLNERSFFKNFNRKNSIIIESKEDNIEIILVTKLLCEKIFKN